MEMLLILLGVSVPVGLYMWREARYKNPATRWPEIGSQVEFNFTPDPPRLEGVWKGRQMTLTFAEAESVLTTPLNCKRGTRMEIGPVATVEQEAGMVVHDRIQLHDPAFERRYLLRSTPPEIGEGAVDPSMRQRLMQLPFDIRVLAGMNRLDVRLPVPTEASDLRTYFDIAGALADSIDGN